MGRNKVWGKSCLRGNISNVIFTIILVSIIVIIIVINVLSSGLVVC